MRKNCADYFIPNSIKEDPLSIFIKGFTFVPHNFGHQCNDAMAVCDYRVIGDFELIYIIGGESFITVGQNEYVCGEGDFVLIPPFTRNRIQTSAQNPHNNFWFHFDVYPFYRQNDFIEAVTRGEANRVHIGCSKELTSLYEALENEINFKRPGSLAFLNAILMQVIITILRGNESSEIFKEDRSNKSLPGVELVNKCFEYIQKNIEKPISVENLTSFLHISESYLFKTFSKVMKMSPNHFIQMIKLKNAEQVMTTTSCSFKEISEMLGFSSPYYFCNVFKKYYHMSPREYMRIFNSIQT